MTWPALLVISTFGLGPTGAANTKVSDAGETATVLSAAGVEDFSELSAAYVGELHHAPTSPATSRTRLQRRVERVRGLVEFFKVHQR
jgi:hypothetical protein